MEKGKHRGGGFAGGVPKRQRKIVLKHKRDKMNQGKIHIYTGDGHGKTPAAWGEALYAASEGKSVVIVQFMKDSRIVNSAFVQRLEPEASGNGRTVRGRPGSPSEPTRAQESQTAKAFTGKLRRRSERK